MFNKWISKVLNTIPFIGNITQMTYVPDGTVKKPITAFFLPIKIDGEVKGLALVPSEIARYVERSSKYSKPVSLDPHGGTFCKNTVIQLSSSNNKKMTLRDFYVGFVFSNGNVTQLFMSQSNIDAAVKKFAGIKDKLNFKLTWKQKLVMWLSKLRHLPFEVYKP